MVHFMAGKFFSEMPREEKNVKNTSLLQSIGSNNFLFVLCQKKYILFLEVAKKIIPKALIRIQWN